MLDNIIPQEKDVAKIFTPEGLEPFLATIEKDARAFKGDMESVNGRKEIASAAHKVAKTKVAIDDLGKELVADLKAKTSAVDAQRKIFRDRMDALKEEVRAPLTEWEETEAKREAELKDRLDKLTATAQFTPAPTSDSIQEALQKANALYQFDWRDHQPLADEKYEAVKTFLNTKLAERKTYEAEQIELERLRKEAAARAAKDREDQIASAAAEKARKEVEDKAEAERKRVEEAAKLTAKIAENARLEAEAKAKKAEEERLGAVEKAEREKKEAEAQAERLRIAAANDKAVAEERARRAEEALIAEKERSAAEAKERARKAYDSYSGAIKEWAAHHKIDVTEGMILDLIHRLMGAANNNKQKKAA